MSEIVLTIPAHHEDEKPSSFQESLRAGRVHADAEMLERVRRIEGAAQRIQANGA